MVDRPPAREYRSVIDSSPRWEHFTHRPGDVFVCTPAKVGTTWTQGIVRSLIFGGTEPPGSIPIDAPWIDSRFEPIETMVDRLDAQTHRRCIKTHTPADGIPIHGDAFYIAVYRAGRDSFMSWVNHIRSMRIENMGPMLEEAVAEGVAFGSMPDLDDVHDIYAHWVAAPPQLEHFDTWWPLRAEPNVMLLHYDDLLTDIDGEMRHLADWIGIDVDANDWARVVERCSLEEMRSAHQNVEQLTETFVGGAATFFNKGTNGRWRDVLSDIELSTYDEMLHQRLPDDATREWFEQGSLATGARPSET